MNRIRLLSEQVANQIAAGEVVERPASVVKELVENALDARPSRITVEIQAGGRALIRVTDDGMGMSRDDALLCLERHATSKIGKAEDLHAIATMGFRGEALPSLASVSRMVLTTRERDGGDAGEAATQVVIHGGKIIEVKAAGAPPGTCVEARQLFYNLPARRKFLRSEETERAHIQHYLTLAALSFPEVAFTFIQDQRTIWQLPAISCEPPPARPLAALRERLRMLHGSADGFLPVDGSENFSASSSCEGAPITETIAVRLWGYIGAPGISRSSRDTQHLFVNRRPVENRGLNYALIEAYHNSLMKGRYPVCCLFLEIDPAEVDVNIHPAKREIKFRHEFPVRRCVTQMLRGVLTRYHAQTPGATETPPPLPTPMRPAEDSYQPPGASPAPATAIAPVPSGGQPVVRSEPDEKWRVIYPAGLAAPHAPPAPPPSTFQSVLIPETESAAVALSSVALAGTPPGEAPPLLSVPLKVVGVVGRLYVVLESDRGMVLLDQHAAHERVLYEQMLKRLEQGDAPSQRLLLAETIELSVRDAQFLRDQLATLIRLGVGLSEFGDRTFLLDALPPCVQTKDARGFVLALIDEMKESGQAVNAWRLGEHVVAKTVCRHAVKAHDPLHGRELAALLDSLRQCSMPYTCPHGRPTLIEMSYRELEKRFGRVV
jgi:DNA mismatch repair protein MutL